MNDHMSDVEDSWDLSGLLETIEPPVDGLAQLRRRLRRWRWGRRGATAVGVVGVVAAVVGFLVPGGAGGGRRQVVVAGPPTTVSAPPSHTTTPTGSQLPAAGSPAGSAGQTEPPSPVVSPAPASAGPGWKPFDVGGLRLWLPPNWYDSDGSVCAGEAGYQFTIQPPPCSQSTDQIAIDTQPGAPSLPAGWQTIVVNGLTVDASPGSNDDWHIPRLRVGLSATGPIAQAVAATVQASPAEDVIEASNALPSTVPAGWKHVAFDGLSLAVPPSWPVHDPSTAFCSQLTGGAVDLGQPTVVPTCPAPLLGAPTVGPADGVAVRDSSNPDPHAPALAQATTAGGARLALSSDGVGQSLIEADVTAAGKTFAVVLGVGTDPSIAWNILGSMAPSSARAAGE